MATTGTLSHIDISVGYPQRSIAFYHAFLTALGYRRWRIAAPEWSGDEPTRATWSRDARGWFAVRHRSASVGTDSRDRRYDRYQPGPHHLAFHAQSDAHVDRVHEAVASVGGEVLDPPRNYGGTRGYGEYYYAVFFADPDGIKLEVCHVPDANP